VPAVMLDHLMMSMTLPEMLLLCARIKRKSIACFSRNFSRCEPFLFLFLYPNFSKEFHS